MRKQPSSEILTARDDGKEHPVPPKEMKLGYSTNREAVLIAGKPVEKCASFLGAVAETSELRPGSVLLVRSSDFNLTLPRRLHRVQVGSEKTPSGVNTEEVSNDVFGSSSF